MSRARCTAVSGSPVARASSRSQRTDSPGMEDPLREEPPRLAPPDEPSGLALERRAELGSDEVPVEIRVVVDGRARDVDLGGPVGLGAPGRRREELVARDEPPPERGQVGLGIGVERPLEVRHHEHPAREDEHLGRAGRIEARLQLGRLGGVDARDLAKPAGVLREAAHEDRDALGDGQVAAAEQPRQARVDAEVEDAVPELVQHRVGPVAVGRDVREDADVALAVDVDAERVLALAVTGIEVAPLEDRRRLEARSRRMSRARVRRRRPRRTRA